MRSISFFSLSMTVLSMLVDCVFINRNESLAICCVRERCAFLQKISSNDLGVNNHFCSGEAFLSHWRIGLARDFHAVVAALFAPSGSFARAPATTGLSAQL